MQHIETIDVDVLLDAIAGTFPVYLKQYLPDLAVEITPFYPQRSSRSLINGIRLMYHLQDRQPASMKEPFRERTFLTPRPLQSAQAPTNLQRETIWEMHYDNLVEFQIAALDYPTALKSALIFEEFMQVSRPLFKSRGVGEVLFWERRPDDVEDIDGTLVYLTTLRYFVRTLRRFKTSQTVIREIEIALNERMGIR